VTCLMQPTPFYNPQYKYARLHDFDKGLTKRLRNQLKLDFDNREIADEQVCVRLHSIQPVIMFGFLTLFPLGSSILPSCRETQDP